MAKKTCECCGKTKGDLETKEWGHALLLCGTCRKQGRAKVLARVGEPAKQEEPKAEHRSPPAAEPAKRKAKEPKPPRVSIGGTIRELHAAGKTNDEIWAVIQPQFSMADTKKWYVSWYIWDAKRKAAK